MGVLLDWLFSPSKKAGSKKKARHWSMIYMDGGFASPLNNPRNIPRWLRKRVLGLERLEGGRFYVLRGKRYEYRVSFTANHGHGRIVEQSPRRVGGRR